MTSAIFFVPEFVKRRLIVMLLQKIYHAPTNYSVNETLDDGRFLLAVSDDVQVIGHDHIGQDQESA